MNPESARHPHRITDPEAYRGIPAAAWLDRLRPEIPSIVTGIPELKELANRLAKLHQSHAAFDPKIAKAEYEAECARLRADGSQKAIKELKSQRTLPDTLAHYAEQQNAIQEEINATRREALPFIQQGTRAIAARLCKLADEAQARENALYAEWGLEAPAQSAIRASVMRGVFELENNCDREGADWPVGVGVEGFLRWIGQD